MRRDPGYRAAWVAHAGTPPRFEAAAFPLSVQSGADLLAAADWSLLAWEDTAWPTEELTRKNARRFRRLPLRRKEDVWTWTGASR